MFYAIYKAVLQILYTGNEWSNTWAYTRHIYICGTEVLSEQLTNSFGKSAHLIFCSMGDILRLDKFVWMFVIAPPQSKL